MITLVQAKEHLRVRHDEQDDYITLLMNSALAALEKYAGDNYDPLAEDIDAAHLLYIEHLFYPPEKVDLDPETQWSMAVAALMKAYRLPTLA